MLASQFDRRRIFGHIAQRVRAFTSIVSAAALAALLAAPLAGAASWVGPTELSNDDTSYARELVLDANAAGQFAAAWRYQYVYDGNQISQGVAATSGSFGAAASAPAFYDGADGANRWAFERPSLSIGADGFAALAFLTKAHSQYGVFSVLKPAGSSTFGTEAAIHGPTTDLPGNGGANVHMSPFGSPLMIHSAGKYAYGFAHNKIVGRKLTDVATNTWSTSTEVTTAEPEAHERASAMGADGSVAVLMDSRNGLGAYVAHSMLVNADGSIEDGSSIWATSGGSATGQIAVVRTPDHGVIATLVAKRHSGDTNRVRLREYSRARAGAYAADSGNSLWADIGTTASTQPRLASNSNGAVILTWIDVTSTANGGNTLRAMYRPAGSSTWGATETIIGDPTNTVIPTNGYYDIAMDVAGNVTLAYRDTASKSIKVVRRSTTWSAPETVSGAFEADQVIPRVADVDANRAVVAFVALNGQPTGVYGRRAYVAHGDFTPPAPPKQDETPKDEQPKGEEPVKELPVAPVRGKIKPVANQWITRAGSTGKVQLTFPAIKRGTVVTGNLTITASVARSLKLPVKRGQKSVVLGTAKHTINSGGAVKVTFTLNRKARAALRAATKRKSLSMTATLTFRNAAERSTLRKLVKLGLPPAIAPKRRAVRLAPNQTLTRVKTSGKLRIKFPAVRTGTRVNGSLRVSAAVARKLGLRVNGAKPVVIGNARTSVRGTGAVTVSFTLTRPARAALAKAGAPKRLATSALLSFRNGTERASVTKSLSLAK